MSRKKEIIDEYRVGDSKPDFFIEFEQLNLTGYVFTMLYTRQAATPLSIAGNITQPGDGADIPGVVQFPFTTSTHTAGMNSAIIEWDDGTGEIESLDVELIFDIGEK